MRFPSRRRSSRDRRAPLLPPGPTLAPPPSWDWPIVANAYEADPARRRQQRMRGDPGQPATVAANSAPGAARRWRRSSGRGSPTATQASSPHCCPRSHQLHAPVTRYHCGQGESAERRAPQAPRLAAADCDQSCHRGRHRQAVVRVRHALHVAEHQSVDEQPAAEEDGAAAGEVGASRPSARDDDDHNAIRAAGSSQPISKPNSPENSRVMPGSAPPKGLKPPR